MLFLRGLLMLVLSGVFLCGCVPQQELLRYRPDSLSPVCVGLVLPLSGPEASQGKRMLNGAVLAVDEINSSRGHFGRRVKLIVCDSGSTVQGAAKGFEQAVNSGAIGVVGGYSTPEAQAMSPCAKRFRVPFVIAMATGNDDRINANPFVFRAVFTDKQQAAMLAGYLKYYRRANRITVAASADPDAVYSRNAAQEIVTAFKELGGKHAFLREIRTAAPEAALREIIASLPDAVVLPFEGKKAGQFFRLLRQYGYNGLICGTDSWDDQAFFDALRGMKRPGNNFYIAFFNGESSRVEFLNFKNTFRKKRFYLPGSCEVQTFDAVNMLLTGFGKNAGTLKQFQKNWLSMRKYPGAAAIYTMLPGNKIDRTMYINRVGISGADKSKFVPKNITGLQHSRLKAYAVDDE
ncbi:MAG: amino acid ABC transporter substrate-binding protein [Lentisphaerae bacterium]|nr:amino acid ABC transporter substrate-binding protein [Lentisphaerota bacterium]